MHDKIQLLFCAYIFWIRSNTFTQSVNRIRHSCIRRYNELHLFPLPFDWITIISGAPKQFRRRRRRIYFCFHTSCNILAFTRDACANIYLIRMQRHIHDSANNNEVLFTIDVYFEDKGTDKKNMKKRKTERMSSLKIEYANSVRAFWRRVVRLDVHTCS